jgi:hypothetical protein
MKGNDLSYWRSLTLLDGFAVCARATRATVPTHPQHERRSLERGCALDFRRARIFERLPVRQTFADSRNDECALFRRHLHHIPPDEYRVSRIASRSPR